MKTKINMRKHIALLPGYTAVILWSIFIFIMISWILFASLSTTREIFSGEIFKFETGLHLENYVNALFKHNVGAYFINSTIYTVISGVSVILLACPAAYVLSRFVFKGKTLILNMFVAAMSIPSIMVVMPLFAMATKVNLTNSRAVLIFLYICILVPFTLYFMTNFFRDLPASLEEAAYIDGATPIYTFWKIMFPLAQPGIITVVIFNFITIWNEYFMALVFVNDAKYKPVASGLQAMIQSMKYVGDWAGLFAAVVIVFLPTFIIYIFLSEKIIAGVTGGAVKG